MSALKIVHVVCTGNFAGVESHVAALAGQQVSDGDEVTVIGGDAIKMPATGTFTWHPGTSAWAAANALRKLPATVVHAHMTRAEVAASLMSSRRPVVATRHFARRRAASSGGFLAPLISWQVAAQISVSQFVADAIETPSIVIPAGVPCREAVRARDRSKIVLVLQRLEAEKRPLVAVNAFHVSKLWRRGWRLVLAGGGSLTDAVKRHTESLGLADNVDFVGHLDDPTGLLRTARVLLATCPIEAQGLAVLEAMSYALPVVAAAAGGHMESVGSVPGAALFDPGDHSEAADWLRRLADDQGLADSYGHDLQQRQRDRFTLRAQSRDTRRVYEEVV